MDKNSKLLTKINFTESYTRDMVLKFLPEPTYDLNMFQKKLSSIISTIWINYWFNFTGSSILIQGPR